MIKSRIKYLNNFKKTFLYKINILTRKVKLINNNNNSSNIRINNNNKIYSNKIYYINNNKIYRINNKSINNICNWQRKINT